MSGLFGDLDMDTVANDPWSVEDGTYHMLLEECSAGPTNKGDKKGMTFKWKVVKSDDRPDMLNRYFSEWLEIPVPADPKNLTDEESKKASRLKSRLLSLGVPESRVNLVTTGELTNIEAIIRLGTTSKNGNDYQNIRDLKLVDATGADDNAANPFAGMGIPQ